MSPTIIKVMPNGPLLVQGDAELVDRNGKAFPCRPGKAMALCRCGHSHDKPYCDGSHLQSDFSSEETADSK